MNSDCKENLTDPQSFSPLSELVTQKVEIMKYKHQKQEEQQKIKIDLLLSIKDDLSKQKTSLEKLLKDEQKYSEELENRIQLLNKQFAEVLQRSEESSKSLMEKITALASENQLYHKENLDLKLELREKELKIFYIQEHLTRISVTNSDIQIEEYKKRTEELSDLYMKSEKERDFLQNFLKSSTESSEKIIKSVPTSQLEESNKSLIKDIRDLQDEIKFHKLQQTELKLENSILKESNNRTASQESEKIDKLSLRVKELESENLSLASQVKTLQEQKDKLEKEMDEFKCKVMHSARLERSHIDDIDLALEKYFAGQGLENQFVKISSGLYVFGTKKVNILMRNEKIVCRVDGCYYFIEEFLKVDQSEKKGIGVGSPASAKREKVSVVGKHGRNSTWVSHLVSPQNKTRPKLSFDFDNLGEDRMRPFALHSVKNSKKPLN